MRRLPVRLPVRLRVRLRVRLLAVAALAGAALLMGAHAAPPAGARSASAPPGGEIRVRGVSGDTVLRLVPSPGGGLVRVDVLARLLGGTLDSVAAGRWRLGLYGVTLELLEDAPFASYNGFPLPLIEATRLVDGRPHVSLQLFSEVIPRFAIGILWDRTRSEVRLFQAIARRAAPLPTDAGETTTVKPPVATPVALERIGPTDTPRPATPPTGLSRRYTVAVDAGHGGVDPGNGGAIVDRVRQNESKLTLAIAFKVEQELLKRGIGVVMTRRTDTLIALHERGPIANAKKADLFLSIHTNAANVNWKNGSAVRGFETYFLSEARTEDERRVAAMENEVVRFESTVDAAKGDPLSFIMNDLAQNEHLRESSDLAEVVQRALGAVHPGPSRGVKQAGFSVLMRAFMPAVLIEVGFGTNPADARWMASAEGQRTVAVSIADATFEYLQHYERRTRASPR